MEENKRILNALSKKSLTFRTRSLNENPALQNIQQNLRILLADPLFEHLTNGLHEWINIQNVIRSALKLFHQAINYQSESIQFVTQNSFSKTDYEDICERLTSKTEAEETKKLFSLLAEKLAGKVDLKDLENVDQNFVHKSNFLDHQKSLNKRLFEMENTLLNKTNHTEFEFYKENQFQEMLNVKNNFKKMEDEIKSLKEKVAIHENIIESSEKRIKTSEQIVKDLKPILQNCVSKTEFNENMLQKVDFVR